MLNKIKEIKRQFGNDLIILAHHYQPDEIVELADFIGDSLKLAQEAKKSTEAKYIIFCGVHFMAETADILTSDEQIVFMPDMNAGCPMADMADEKQIDRAWKIITDKFGSDIVPITYINSKASIKSFCGKFEGTTVTSSNADKILKWGLEQKKRVLFLPDQNLGRNTACNLGIPLKNMALYDQLTEEIQYNCNTEDVKIILWNGYCHVHHNIKVENINKIRQEYENIKIIVHPECRNEIVLKSDMNGSTEYIINKIKQSEKGSRWAVGTEKNLVNRLIKQNKDKEIIAVDQSSCCSDMNNITLESLYNLLESIRDKKFKNIVKVDKEISKNAVKALNKMLYLS